MTTSHPLAMVPNALTVLRLVIAAAFPFVPQTWRLWLVAAGGASDALDGLIARRFGLTTWIGALLDGIADKAFTLSVLGTLAAAGVLSPWMLPLLLARDIAVALMAAIGVIRRQWWGFRKATARPLGKATTVALVVAVLLLLLGLGAAPVALWLAAALSVLAAIDYFATFLRAQRQRPSSVGD